MAPGEIAFALLVFRVEVAGYSYSGAQVYSRKLGGFTFGDSKSGTWSRKLKGIPSNAGKVNMVFYGNYE